MDEDAFLPSENDKLKAQIKEMRRRLAAATIRDRELRKELLEEDLSYMTVSTLTALIQDPTRVAEYELDDMSKEVFNRMISTLEACCIREAISYHRLAGRSIFEFKGNRSCIRLETFYNRTYQEAYYILYEKNQGYRTNPIQSAMPSLIDHHTVPNFIHLEAIEKKYLPGKFDTFIRIVHDQVQAYVTKREMLKEIAQLKKSYSIEIKYQSESIHKVEIELTNTHGQKMQINMSFENKSSSYPTSTSICYVADQPSLTDDEDHQLSDFAQEFQRQSLMSLLLILFQNDVTELHNVDPMEIDETSSIPLFT